MRIGLGFDAHAFSDDRPLVLAGVTLPGPGLSGHSDADVVSHALADALLGAASLGDLGEHFPDTERWRDASSLDILTRAAEMVAESGQRVINVDVTVIAQSPRLGPHRTEMTAAVARALGVEALAISVKATTTDAMGFTGRGEGIAALAVALVDAT